MASAARTHHQLGLPPAPLQKVSSPEPGETLTAEERAASQDFDAAIASCGLAAKVIAIHAGVSESLVSRWRSPQHRDFPNIAQIERLPLEFQAAYLRLRFRRTNVAAVMAARVTESVQMLGLAAGL